jgi:hypothetical protein
MKFLIKKYPKLKDSIPTYLQRFETQEHEKKLFLEKQNIKDNWEKYKVDILKIN